MCFQISVRVWVGPGFIWTDLPIPFPQCCGRKQTGDDSQLGTLLSSYEPTPRCVPKRRFQRIKTWMSLARGCVGHVIRFPAWCKLTTFGSRWLASNNWRSDFRWKWSWFSLQVTSEVFCEIVPAPIFLPPYLRPSQLQPLKTVFAEWPAFQSTLSVTFPVLGLKDFFSIQNSRAMTWKVQKAHKHFHISPPISQYELICRSEPRRRRDVWGFWMVLGQDVRIRCCSCLA